jgi:hypothetical protein
LPSSENGAKYNNNYQLAGFFFSLSLIINFYFWKVRLVVSVLILLVICMVYPTAMIFVGNKKKIFTLLNSKRFYFLVFVLTLFSNNAKFFFKDHFTSMFVQSIISYLFGWLWVARLLLLSNFSLLFFWFTLDCKNFKVKIFLAELNY